MCVFANVNKLMPKRSEKHAVYGREQEARGIESAHRLTWKILWENRVTNGSRRPKTKFIIQHGKLWQQEVANYQLTF